MEQDRKSRDKPMYLWIPYFLTKEARIYDGAKTVSSISAAGKTGQLCVKNEIRTLFNTLYKDKFKMD